MSNENKPAFPQDAHPSYITEEMKGLTTLQYFMAHCPAVPEWFEPEGYEFESEPDSKVVGTAELHKWYRKRDFEKLMQWPSFYAREQIKRSGE